MRIYRALLRLYPASFREEYGGEMSAAFARARRDARGALAVAALWATASADIVVNAARVHADMLRQDVRVSIRTLARTPGFTAAALIVTALGVGATTAAFTLTDHVLLRPLPFREPDRLVKILQGSTTRDPGLRGLRGTNDISPALLTAWKSSSTSFAAMGAYGMVSANLSGDGEPERLDGADVAEGTLDTLGVPPALGRGFLPAEHVTGAPCSVVISDGLWQRHFGADSSAVGRRVRIDQQSCEVVGVMPRGFNFPTRSTAFWRAMRLSPDALRDLGEQLSSRGCAPAAGHVDRSGARRAQRRFGEHPSDVARGVRHRRAGDDRVSRRDQRSVAHAGHRHGRRGRVPAADRVHQPGQPDRGACDRAAARARAADRARRRTSASGPAAPDRESRPRGGGRRGWAC